MLLLSRLFHPHAAVSIKAPQLEWLLQPDHPAVMVYAGANAAPPAATDTERLYAFGIDAYRLATALLNGTDLAREALDGVTGRIWLGADRHFVRELTAARARDPSLGIEGVHIFTFGGVASAALWANALLASAPQATR